MTAQTSPIPPAENEGSEQVAVVKAATVSNHKKSASAFRTISEVADELQVQQHVLRFWETKFSQIRPLKRGGGRRYYRPEDVDLLKTVHKLLYSEGYTIKGVQKLFREKGKNQVVEKAPVAVKTAENENFTEKQRAALQAIAGDLKELRKLLQKETQA